jgi:hypothetical protein
MPKPTGFDKDARYDGSPARTLFAADVDNQGFGTFGSN